MLRAHSRCKAWAVRMFIHNHSPLSAHADRFVLRAAGLRNSLHATSCRPVDGAVGLRKDVGRSLQQQKLDNLLHSLDRYHLDPNRIWRDYVDLLDFAVAETVPLRLHQLVLRKCSPETKVMRASSVKDVGRWLVNPFHPHEARFRMVLRQIRSMGCVPTLDDYHTILEQFVAVGDCNGAMQLLEEIVDADLEPRTRTFGLCLQAIVFRLALPCRQDHMEELQKKCASWLLRILDAIRERNRMIPPACLDIALRIIKDTGQTAPFVSLMQSGFGIDIYYPDRPPSNHDAEGDNLVPFTTSTLTTVVDFLGRQKDIPKMVQIFEVLTTKPSTSRTGPSRNAFEDDDDDAVYPSELPSHLVPSARPNIATYNSMIRHCAQCMCRTLAMHYFSQVMDLDNLWSQRLRNEILTKPVTAIDAPEVQVNRDTFASIRGLASRYNDVALMKKILRLLRETRRGKSADLEYFAAQADKIRSSVSIADDRTETLEGNGFAHERTLQESHLESSCPDLGASQFSSSAWLEILWKRHERLLSVSRPNNLFSRPFDLTLHISRLRRDVSEMKLLEDDLGDRVSRMSINKKEHIGRRVWKGETIYLRDIQKRIAVDRGRWKGIVNFNAHIPHRHARPAQLLEAASS